MSANGPSMMYQVQRPAFEARKTILDACCIGPSTSTTPPQIQAINIQEVCALKKQAITNKPLNCVHCGAKHPERSIIETKDGSIIAYCREKGACGKSNVIFAGIELSTPQFEQVCPFQHRNHIPEPIIFNNDSLTSQQIPSQPFSPGDLPAELTQEPIVQRPMFREITMEDHSPTCALCGKRYHEHKQDCDEFGWRICSRKPVVLPADWPVFQPDLAIWQEKGSCNVF